MVYNGLKRENAPGLRGLRACKGLFNGFLRVCSGFSKGF